MEGGYCDEGATTEVKTTETPTAIAVRSERAQSVNMDTVFNDSSSSAMDSSSSAMDNDNSEEHWTTNPQTPHKSSAISPTTRNSTQQEPSQISTSANTSNRSVRREVSSCERLCGGSGGGEGGGGVRERAQMVAHRTSIRAGGAPDTRHTHKTRTHTLQEKNTSTK